MADEDDEEEQRRAKRITDLESRLTEEQYNIYTARMASFEERIAPPTDEFKEANLKTLLKNFPPHIQGRELNDLERREQYRVASALRREQQADIGPAKPANAPALEDARPAAQPTPAPAPDPLAGLTPGPDYPALNRTHDELAKAMRDAGHNPAAQPDAANKPPANGKELTAENVRGQLAGLTPNNPDDKQLAQAPENVNHNNWQSQAAAESQLEPGRNEPGALPDGAQQEARDPAAVVRTQDEQKQKDLQQDMRSGKTLSDEQKANASPEISNESRGTEKVPARQSAEERFLARESKKGRDGRDGGGRGR